MPRKTIKHYGLPPGRAPRPTREVLAEFDEARAAEIAARAAHRSAYRERCQAAQVDAQRHAIRRSITRARARTNTEAAE